MPTVLNDMNRCKYAVRIKPQGWWVRTCCENDMRKNRRKYAAFCINTKDTTKERSTCWLELQICTQMKGYNTWSEICNSRRSKD